MYCENTGQRVVTSLTTRGSPGQVIQSCVSLQDVLTQFSSFNYWRAPIADIHVLLADLWPLSPGRQAGHLTLTWLQPMMVSTDIISWVTAGMWLAETRLIVSRLTNQSLIYWLIYCLIYWTCLCLFVPPWSLIKQLKPAESLVLVQQSPTGMRAVCVGEMVTKQT